MTWVIGESSKFGYGLLVSDIQVRFSNGKTANILQKVYPLGKFIAGGFAGSVKIGFDLLDSLKKFLQPPVIYEKDYCVYPHWVAEKWSNEALSVWNNSSENEKNLGSKFLIVAAYPSNDYNYLFGNCKICIIRVSSPEFKPKIINKIGIWSIGSGSQVKEYKNAIKSLIKNEITPEDEVFGIELFQPGTIATNFLFRLSRTIEKRPNEFSKNLHMVTVKVGEIFICNNDTRIYRPNTDKPEIIEMPKVAKSYSEFCIMCKGRNIDASGAKC